MPAWLPRALLPFLAACAGVAVFSMMDAAMKSLSIALGAYNAVLWRNLVGSAIGGGAFVLGQSAWPTRAAMRLHLERGVVIALMALLFFYGLARIPMAEAIALTFIAPLIALYLAAIMLGETIGRAAIIASLLGIAGVVVIVWGKFGGGDYAPDAPLGVAALFGSSLLFAYNLILARRQAQIARPVEIAFFQSLIVAASLMLAAPWFAVPPPPAQLPLVALAALFAFISLLLLSWAYARAEAQVLIPVEYTAFVWAALLGWWVFGEALTLPVLIGTALIVTGSLIAARVRPASVPQVEQAVV